MIKLNFPKVLANKKSYASRKPLCGVGINDWEYQVRVVIDGKRKIYSIYNIWHNMIIRCYSEKYQEMKPTYKGCFVCDEWLLFSNFEKWASSQDWDGKALDKDILKTGNKEYSPEYCVFIPKMTNSIVTDGRGDRGEFKIGVIYHKKKKRFVSRCSFNGESVALGHYSDEKNAALSFLCFKSFVLYNEAMKFPTGKIKTALIRISKEIRYGLFYFHVPTC